MKARYIPDCKEWLVDSKGHSYRIGRCESRFILEEIEPPCNDLRYIADFATLGAALEAVMRDEMQEDGGDCNA